ncbi:hypothetical protein Tco_1139306 [Tanacetum coccineum]
MQTRESKVDLGKALDSDLVVTESSRTESGKQDTSSKSGSDVEAYNADIKPVYDEEPMADVQLATEQLEIINEGSGVGVDTVYLRYAISSWMDTVYWLSE